MSMTLQEYQRLMQALSTELSAARSLGRDEGTSAMEVVVHRLSDHMGRMYQEGQGLHNRCIQMEATMKAEIDKAAAWYEQQLKEVKKTGDVWVQNYKADLDRRFEEEKAELRAKIQHDSESLQQRLLLSDKNSSDTAQQRLEEITRDMTEKFNQQKREYQE